MTPRTIVMRLTSDDVKELQISTDYDEVLRAIGRLATWAASAYDTVTIMRDGTRDLIALYENEGSSERFVMGAVWREGSYELYS